MSLLKWVGLGTGQNGAHTSSTSAKNTQAPPSAPAAPPQPDNPALTTARWDHKRFGMENFGNTCYANSVLQALYYCDPFRQLLCDAPDRTYPTGPAAFTTAPPLPPQSAPAAKPRPAHGRRPSTGPDQPTPHAMSYMGGAGAAFVATAFISPPGGTPHKTTSAPTPAPIVNVGPVIPAAPPTLFSALRSLFIHIAANPADKGTVSPRAFVEKLKKENELFRSNMHQDAHEFLNYLLNSVVEDLTEELKAGPPEDLSKSIASTSSGISRGTSSYSNPNLTLVHDLFEGTLTSETRCLTCETVSSRDESFLDLSIDIERNSSVTACLRQFSASEMLCQKNKFFCDSCCGLQEAEKRMKIKKLPNVLALHLKRFKYQEDVQRYIKLSYRVAFPFELRLFNTVDDAQDPDRLYELFAIVVHVGSGPHHGHYITIAKQRGQWLMFDDDVVEPVRESEIPKYFGDSPAGSGYVLFYQAVNIDLQALGVKTPPSPQTATVIPQQSIPPVVVDAPTSPIVEDMAEGRVSPGLSESGTIGTPSPSTPTRSHPPSSPVISKMDAPSTAPSSAPGSGFTNPIRSKPSRLALGGSGSVSAQESTSGSINGSNGDASHEAPTKEKESRTGSLSSSWFRWGNKKKGKDTPSSSRKPTLDDSRLPTVDIRRPSAPAMMETPPLLTPSDGSPRLHDEPEQAVHSGGLFDLGRMTDDPVSASISANSSGDHLYHSMTLPQPAEHHFAHTTSKPMTAHPSPPRASRSGSVSATTNGSGSGSTSGLHVPSYRPSGQASPSASSSASSVSTPMRHDPLAHKLSAPFPLKMSPMKEGKPSRTVSSSAVTSAENVTPTLDTTPRTLAPPPFATPTRTQSVGFSETPQAVKTKVPRRKLSFSIGALGRSKDKAFGKIGHDRRMSIAEDVEALPALIPSSPLNRK